MHKTAGGIEGKKRHYWFLYWLFSLSEYILLVIFKWYFCFDKLESIALLILVHLILYQTYRKDYLLRIIRKKNLSYIEWYKLNHLSSPFFLQILMCPMCGCLKEKGHTEYIALKTQHFDYIFQDKHCDTAQPSFPRLRLQVSELLPPSVNSECSARWGSTINLFVIFQIYRQLFSRAHSVESQLERHRVLSKQCKIHPVLNPTLLLILRVFLSQ